MTTHVIRIFGLIGGGTTVYDGEYVVEYDPSIDGVEPGTGKPMNCHLVTTPDIAKASRYSVADAHTLWTLTDLREPVRSDGKPNRPLTAFTVSIEPAE